MSSCSAGHAGSGNADDEAPDDASESEMTDVATLTSAQVKAVGLQLGTVQQRQLSNVVKANGRLVLSAQDRAEVASLMGGVVQRIVVSEGQHVSAGQVVAWLENTQVVELQKDALVASREAQLAQGERARQEALAQQNAGVEKNLQEARAMDDVAQARLMGLRRQMQQLGIDADAVEQGHIVSAVPIKSPIAGIVARISVSTGSYVDMQTPLMTVNNVDAVFCSLDVFDKDIEDVHIGQRVDIRHSSLSASDLSGSVAQVNKAIDPVTKAFAVHVKLDRPDSHTLVPGMYVNALIHTGAQLCNALPSDAIVSIAGRSFVFVLLPHDDADDDDSHPMSFAKTEVFVGAQELGFSQVAWAADSIPASAQVVVRGAYYLCSVLGDHGEED